MIETFSLQTGITLRCFRDARFKQGSISIQFVRPMCREEAALNALLPAVLLRGTQKCKDLRAIIRRLDDLYGASVGVQVRRIGDYQTTGLSSSFIDDRFAFEGDEVLVPMIAFLQELLMQPALEKGVFVKEYVNSEKKNLIATIEAQRNDKRAYASGQMLKTMCAEDSFGIPRLGEIDKVQSIDAQKLYDHYQKILAESAVDILYVGSAEPKMVAQHMTGLFADVKRNAVALPEQTPFRDAGGSERTEQMEVAQGKLAMGFVTPITIRDRQFAAMQVCNTIFGSGMTSKLFTNIREKQSLCYDISSGYHGSKGIVTVSAGIDFDKKALVREQILSQLHSCCDGDITPHELQAAKQAIISSLQGTHDTPSAIDSYYSSAALSGLAMTPQEYICAVRAVTAEQVVEAARSVKLHTVYFLEGVR